MGQHRDFERRADATPRPAFEVAVLRTEALPVLVPEHRGSYMAIGRAFDQLLTRVAAAGLATHTGPYSSMQAAYRWLYGDWLVNSGFEPARGPVLEKYFNSPHDTAPQDLRTLIQLPLQSAGLQS